MKTIHYTIAALLCCCSFAAPGQDVQQSRTDGMKGYLAFSGGVSLPQGDYNTTGSVTAPGEYATTGGNFSVSLAITPTHFPLGVAAMGGYYFNRYDFSSFLTYQQATDVNSNYGTNEPNTNSLFYSGFYGMAGLCKDISLGKIVFDFRVLAGTLSLTTPEVSYYAVHPSSSLF